MIVKASHNDKALCNLFSWSNSVSGLKGGRFNFNTYNGFMVNHPSLRTVAEFVAWLANGDKKIKACVANPVPTETDVAPEDLAFLRSLETIPADHYITVTDQDGRDVSYLLEYIRKLNEVNA